MKKTGNIMWIVFALLAAVCAASVSTLSKAAIKNVDSNLTFAIQAILIIIVSWSVVFIKGEAGGLKEIEGKTWLVLILAGILTTASSLFSFRALRDGDASQVNPVQQLSLVFAILFAGLFLREKITLQVILGGLLMAAGAIVIAMAKKA